MHEYQRISSYQWLRGMAASLVVLMCLCGSAAAQPTDAPDKNQVDAAELAKELVGKFGEGSLSIVIEGSGGNFKGTITRDEKQYPFTGELKGTVLNGLIEVAGTKSGFTAKLEDDELALTLGLDTQKLARIDTRPPGDRGRNINLKEVLLAKSEEVQFESEIASPDNRRVGFVIQKDGFRHAVIDGVQGRPYNLAGAITFSPDSQRYFHIGRRKDGKIVVILDEVESEPCDALFQELIAFSPDSKRFAYVCFRDKKWHTVIDGKPSEAYDAINHMTFSPDSKRVAFAGQRGRNWHVVVDGVEQEAVDDIGREGIKFSSDSKHMIYVALVGKYQCAVVDGIKGNNHDVLAGAALTPDGLHTSYVALREGQSVFIFDGKEKGTYETIHGVSFSPDSKRSVVAARNSGKSFHVIDDKPQQAFDAISTPVFSPDNQEIVYAAKIKEKWSLIRKGKTDRFHDSIPFIAFAPDGSHLAYVAIDGDKMRTVIDGNPSQRVDVIWRSGLYFSPDSKHFVFGARRGDQSFLTVDGIEGKPLGEFIPGSKPVFDGPDRFHIITKRGSSYNRVDIQIITPKP